MSKAFIVQQPKPNNNYDFESLDAVGSYEFLLESSPNIHDPERVASDVEHMKQVIESAGPDDFFVTMGGAPLSNILFGLAFERADVDSINFGLYSRGRDLDGRRGGEGSYRIITIDK